MAEDANFYEFKASFEKAQIKAQEFLDEITKDIAIAKSVGDETWAAHLEAQKTALGYGGTTGARGVAGQGGTAEITRQNEQLQKQRLIDAENLDLLKQQTAQRLEQLDLIERQQAAQKLIIPPGVYGGPRSATAGGQIAAEEAAAREAALARLSAGIDPAATAALSQFAARAALAPLVTAKVPSGGPYEDLAAQRSAVELAQKRAEAEARVNAQLARQADDYAALLEREDAYYRALERESALINKNYRDAFLLGQGRGQQGRPLPADLAGLATAPKGLSPEAWTETNAAAVRYNATLGQYSALTARADISNEALINNLTRVGVADAQASDQLRRHGALTTEFLGALARGETTVSEFGYQIGATIAKFAGWTAAAAATYGALGAVVEFAKGAFDASSAVQRLTRTIDGINPSQATQKLEDLSQETNVSMKDAGDAVFAFSRTFHDLDTAVGAARLGLAAQKLDNVDIADSVRASTAITQQYGGGLHQLTNVYNELSASQREYNARISDMIPLLQKSTGAVKNAGGDLTQLIQLGTYATRVTQLSGSQIGTAFYRGAATFTNPATTKGQADLATLRALGVDTTQGYTQLLVSAIERSATLGTQGRSELANAVFGPQYGGRLSAIFNPQAIGTFRDITQGPRAITPATTRGSLQEELSKELGTVGEQAKAFINSMQRLGAAFGQTGVVQDFAIAIHVATLGMDEFRGVLNIFNALPGPVKEAVTAFTALRLAMLFFSRTRIGSTAPLITSVPFFRPSEATQLRSQLAIGGRQAIQQVQQDFAQTQAQITAQAAKQAELQSTRGRLDAEIAQKGRGDLKALEESNAVGIQIQAAKDEQNRLQVLQNDQQRVLLQLQRQQVGLTAINRTNRFTDAQVLALGGATGVSTGAQAGALGAETAATSEASAANSRLIVVESANSAAKREAAAVAAREAAAATENAAASTAETGALEESTAATGGLAARVGGLVTALDPLTIGLLALPFVFTALSSAGSSTNSAIDAANAAIAKPIDSLKDLRHRAALLQQRAAELKQAEQKAADDAPHLDLSGFFDTVFNVDKSIYHAITGGGGKPSRPTTYSQAGGAVSAYDQATLSVGVPANVELDARVTRQRAVVQQQEEVRARQAAAAARTVAQIAKAKTPQGRAEEAKALSDAYDAIAKTANADAKAVVDSAASQEHFHNQIEALRARAAAVARAHPGPDAAAALHTIDQELAQAYQSRARAFVDPGKDPFKDIRQLSPADIEKQVEYLDDFTKVYGSTGNVLQRAAYAYTFLANKFASTGQETDSQLQQISTAQTNFVDTVSKRVGDLIKAASSSPTEAGSQSNLSQAYAAIAQARATEERATAAIIKEDKGNADLIRKAKEAADQVYQQLNDQLQQVNQAALQNVQTQAALAESQVQGSSPAADVQRARVALQGLEAQLAKAQSEHADWQTIAGIITQINNARTALVKQISDNARAIAQAQGQVAVSSITGISPQDDIARVQAGVASAQRLLAFDRSHNAGEAQILQDQASLFDAEHSLNQALQQRDQQIAQDAASLIAANAALSESQTLNPIKQAREELAASIKTLATIRPQDYQTRSQYLAAIRQQRATINNNREKVNDQIIQTDLSNLAFEYQINKIGDQQYINALQAILRSKKLTLQERQQIEEQIYQLKSGQGDTTFNTGNIKIPSVYEIRRAIGLGRQGTTPLGQNTVVNHTSNVTVNVYGERGARAVGAVLDQHLGTSVTAAMRAGGRK